MGKIQNFTRYDIRCIMKILDEIETQYRNESEKHTPERKLTFLATARGASIAKKKIKEYLKSRYNILKI